MIVTAGDGECFWHQVGRTRDATKYPIIRRAASTIKNYLTQKVSSSAKVEKPCTNKTHWELMLFLQHFLHGNQRNMNIFSCSFLKVIIHSCTIVMPIICENVVHSH